MQNKFAGIDLHRNYMTITVMDQEGRVESTNKISNSDTDRLRSVFSDPDYLYKSVVESTYGW